MAGPEIGPAGSGAKLAACCCPAALLPCCPAGLLGSGAATHCSLQAKQSGETPGCSLVGRRVKAGQARVGAGNADTRQRGSLESGSGIGELLPGCVSRCVSGLCVCVWLRVVSWAGAGLLRIRDHQTWIAVPRWASAPHLNLFEPLKLRVSVGEQGTTYEGPGCAAAMLHCQTAKYARNTEWMLTSRRVGARRAAVTLSATDVLVLANPVVGRIGRGQAGC